MEKKSCENTGGSEIIVYSRHFVINTKPQLHRSLVAIGVFHYGRKT